MKCPFCETALPNTNAKFCPECGAHLRPNAQPTSSPTGTPPSPGQPKECAAGPCHDVRLPGSDFCAKHGPKEMPKGRGNPKKAKPPGRLDRFVAKLEAEQEQKRSQDSRIICLYCQQAGQVSTKAKRVKRGVSGGKATGAIVTGGLSIFATGLSRKDDVIEAHCANCGMTWQTQADR